MSYGAFAEVVAGEAVFFILLDGYPGGDAGEAVIIGDGLAHSQEEAVSGGVFGIACEGFWYDGDTVFLEFFEGGKCRRMVAIGAKNGGP